jgi:hypothetical protein
MKLAGRIAAVGSGLLLSVMPAVALGCPQCAGRSDGGAAQLVVLASFVLLPFAVTAVVYKFVKAGEASSRSPL